MRCVYQTGEPLLGCGYRNAAHAELTCLLDAITQETVMKTGTRGEALALVKILCPVLPHAEQRNGSWISGMCPAATSAAGSTPPTGRTLVTPRAR